MRPQTEHPDLCSPVNFSMLQLMAMVGLCEPSANFVSLGKPRGTLAHPLARIESGKANSKEFLDPGTSVLCPEQTKGPSRLMLPNNHGSRQYQLII
jgi:hypothetical protein